ncbi:hypothetical protein RIF29_19688 [Crotalaria pallida]|uniref:Uncharacterized protein n=1 Tax=Crotalaria pallida TaxID=3830 RepID=A0AAN9I6R1_CROPI
MHSLWKKANPVSPKKKYAKEERGPPSPPQLLYVVCCRRITIANYFLTPQAIPCSFKVKRTLSHLRVTLTEIASLESHLEGIDTDSVLDLVLASLPEETRTNGTDTQLQLKQKASSVLFCF